MLANARHSLPSISILISETLMPGGNSSSSRTHSTSIPSRLPVRSYPSEVSGPLGKRVAVPGSWLTAFGMTFHVTKFVQFQRAVEPFAVRGLGFESVDAATFAHQPGQTGQA